MQSLEVIERLNAAAAAADIPQLRLSGQFVVALYSGLNYCSHAAFASAAEAQAYVDQRLVLNEPGERSQVLGPIVAAASVASDDATDAALLTHEVLDDNQNLTFDTNNFNAHA